MLPLHFNELVFFGMKISKDICSTFIKNGMYFWDYNESTCVLEVSESLRYLIGIDDEEITLSRLRCLIPSNYRQMAKDEYQKIGTLWHLPIELRGRLQWFGIEKLFQHIDDFGASHSAGVVKLIAADEMENLVHDSGINLDAVKALIEAVPMLSDSETFADGVHKLLARIYCYVRGSSLGVVQWMGGNVMKCVDFIGKPIGMAAERPFVQGKIIESPLMRRLCESRGATAFDDMSVFEEHKWPVEHEFFRVNKIRSGASAPIIRSDGKVWGLVEIYSNERIRWREFDKEWIDLLAKLIDISLALSQKNISLREQIALTNIACQSSDIETWSWNCEQDELLRRDDKRPIKDGSEYFLKRVHRSDYAKFRNILYAIKDGLTDSIDVNIRYRHPHKPGTRWFRVIGRTVRVDDNGKPRFVSGIFRDINDEMLRKIEERKAEELQKSIYDKLPIGIEIFDEKGKLTYANDKIFDIYGIADSRHKLYKVNFFDRPTLNEVQKRIVRNLTTNNYTFALEYNALPESIRNDIPSSTLDLIVRVSKIYSGKTHRGYVVTMVDNTKTVSMGRRLSLFNKYLLEVGGFAQLGIFWKGEHENQYASAQWITNFNTPNDNRTYNCAFYTNVFPEDLTVFRQRYECLLKSEINTLQMDMRVNHPDNTVHWIRVSFVRNESIHGVTGLSLDITTQKRNEELLIKSRRKAERADLLKSKFIANISHEIRTPLNSIVGFSDLITECEEEDLKRQYSVIIHNSTDLLLKLIGDILDLSKIESGTMEFSYEMHNIHKLCDDVFATMQLKKPDEIDFVYPKSATLTDVMAFCDNVRITQVLINFINNAFKFTKRGYVMLWFDIDEGKLTFHVTDTGRGIAKEDLAQIFDSFVKLDPFAVGTGLGLSICRSIAQQMGGEVEVDSTLGKGSHFRLVLPYLKDATLTWRDAVERTKNIIVLSQDPDMLSFLSYSLEDYNMIQIELVDFFQLWLVKKPPLTIIDVRLCEVTVCEVIASIRSYGGHHHVVVISSSDCPIAQDLLINAGAEEVLFAPIEHKQLMKTVKKYI